MKNKTRIYISIILTIQAAFVCMMAGCKNQNTPQKKYEIAVTNSYLRSAVKDLCGNETEVFCIAPPGMCPGHFDISPAQISQLCSCKILLRFDFQKRIEESLFRLKQKGLQNGSVKTMPGLCIPQTYLTICKDVCRILSAQLPERKSEFEQRLNQIEKRLKYLSSEVLSEIEAANLKKTKVLTSKHQAEFANWLGLETAATFLGSDMETVANIQNCLEKAKQSQIKFIIANEQEGKALADALAERLNAATVVFSNFPQLDIGKNSFDKLVRENVKKLIEAAK